MANQSADPPDLVEPNVVDLTALDSPETELGLNLRITLHKLEIFCQVVDVGGVTRAAEVLFLTQPVVTGHIRSLEEHLGVKLFSRSGRHNVLTEAGERTYRWGREILRGARELYHELDELKGGTRGSVAVAASMSAGSYLLPPVMARFGLKRPNVRLSLNVLDYPSAQETVQAGKVDFAIVIGEGQARLDWLQYETIGFEDLVLVASEDFASRDKSLSAEEVSLLPFVDSPMSGRRELAMWRMKEFGVSRLNIVMELGHPEAMKRAVVNGAGVAMLFRRSVSEDLESGHLTELSMDGSNLHFPIMLLTRVDKELSPTQTELVDAIRREFAVQHD
jgi:LysR family transcriptional regulator, low CO2-responsive transcriptional regulator